MATKKQVETLRKRLVSVAKKQGYIAYSEVDKIFGLDVTRKPKDRNTLSVILGSLGETEMAAKRSFLVAVVVRKGTKRPGRGFYDAARRHCPKYRKIASNLDLHTQAIKDVWSWAARQR